MRVAIGDACPSLPAIASRCAANAGSWTRRRRSPTATLLSLSSRGSSHRRRALPAARSRSTVRRNRRRTPESAESTRRRWMHHLHAQLSTISRVRRAARCRSGAAIDILPFQLEPALALVRGHASRFLLADEVGLGKTIQAGLMLSELRQRGWCERALIVTPAGLRQQWADELLQRFEIHAAVIDAASLAARADSLPFDVNPWSVEPVAITSIDFLKQPEVLHAVVRSVVGCADRRRGASGHSRVTAIRRASTRSPHAPGTCVLLTATPHAGDDRAYRALCAHRTNSTRTIPSFSFAGRGSWRARRERGACTCCRSGSRRQTSRCIVCSTGISRGCGRLRADPASPDVQLIAMVLAKRAFSSARSLATSLERRLAALSGARRCAGSDGAAARCR